MFIYTSSVSIPSRIRALHGMVGCHLHAPVIIIESKKQEVVLITVKLHAYILCAKTTRFRIKFTCTCIENCGSVQAGKVGEMSPAKGKMSRSKKVHAEPRRWGGKSRRHGM